MDAELGYDQRNLLLACQDEKVGSVAGLEPLLELL